MKKYLKFWGTRGSCAVSGAEYLHYGGNTCCLEVRYDDAFLIIDAGTGIRPLGNTLLHHKKIDLFLSHTHWDHLIGFPFFEPIYRKDVHITVWAPEGPGRKCRELFDQLLAKEFFPVHLDEIQAQLQFKPIFEKKPLQVGPLTLDFHTTIHPGLTLCFKIKTPKQTISYVTDNEIDVDSQASFIDFHKGSDLFIHEAQYTPEEYMHKKGWGHSSLSRAVSLIQKVHPGRWIVTHHDPKHTDHDLSALHTRARKLLAESHNSCPIDWATDGHTITLD